MECPQDQSGAMNIYLWKKLGAEPMKAQPRHLRGRPVTSAWSRTAEEGKSL